MKMLTFAEVTKCLANRPHLSTVGRWTSKGVRGHRLASTLIGGRRYVSEDSLREFLLALNANSSGVTVSEPSPRLDARVEKAYDDLSREGVSVSTVEHQTYPTKCDAARPPAVQRSAFGVYDADRTGSGL